MSNACIYICCLWNVLEFEHYKKNEKKQKQYVTPNNAHNHRNISNTNLKDLRATKEHNTQKEGKQIYRQTHTHQKNRARALYICLLCFPLHYVASALHSLPTEPGKRQAPSKDQRRQTKLSTPESLVHKRKCAQSPLYHPSIFLYTNSRLDQSLFFVISKGHLPCNKILISQVFLPASILNPKTSIMRASYSNGAQIPFFYSHILLI